VLLQILFALGLVEAHLQLERGAEGSEVSKPMLKKRSGERGVQISLSYPALAERGRMGMGGGCPRPPLL
jgi:hypothetical protein